MSNLSFSDNDLVLIGGYTTGEVLVRILEADTAPTVVIAGPTFDREARIGVAEFARRADRSDVRLLMPIDAARNALQEGHAAFVPSQSPDYPYLLRRYAADANRVISVFETSEPTEGKVTPGACAVNVPEIVELADVLVAEVNPLAPRLLGTTFPETLFDHQITGRYQLPSAEQPTLDDRSRTIGQTVADIVPDGATIQVGIGRIPVAIAEALRKRSGFGLHSGLVSTVVRELLEDGAVTRGSVVADPDPDCPFGQPAMTTTVLGDGPTFYEWAEASRMIALGDMRQTSNPALVAENPKFTAINGGIQVDLHGQVNAERLGTKQLSGAGGQPAYLRAARQSEGGVGIIALTSTVEDGPSKIVGGLSPEAVTTTQRVDLNYVVTEQAAVELHGLTVAERATQLIEAAAPAHRDDLRAAAQEYGLLD